MENLQNRLTTANSGNYPPYNIILVDDIHYRIEVAVSGFSEDEISVVIDNRQLHITSTVNESNDQPDNFLFQGIARRPFHRTFALAEYVEIASAVVENGILQIDLKLNLPEALKPKEIKIDFKK